MAKAEQKHRHSMEVVVVRGDRDAVVRGQRFGLLALLLLLMLAGYMVHQGNAEAAAALLGTTVVGVVGVFVTGRVLESRRNTAEPEAGADEDPLPTA